MRTRFIALAMLLAPLSGPSAAAEVDFAYEAEHDGWHTLCVKGFAKLKDACLVMQQDTASGLTFQLAGRPFFDEVWGELRLEMPPGTAFERPKGTVAIETDGETHEFQFRLHGLYKQKEDGGTEERVLFLVMASPEYVESYVLESEAVTLTVPHVAGEAIVATFDMTGAAEAWQAFKDHHGLK